MQHAKLRVKDAILGSMARTGLTERVTSDGGRKGKRESGREGRRTGVLLVEDTFPLFKNSLIQNIIFYKLLIINRTPKDTSLSRLS